MSNKCSGACRGKAQENYSQSTFSGWLSEWKGDFTKKASSGLDEGRVGKLAPDDGALRTEVNFYERSVS